MNAQTDKQLHERRTRITCITQESHNEVIQAALEEYIKLCLWRADNLEGDEDDPHKWERHAELAGDLIGSFDSGE